MPEHGKKERRKEGKNASIDQLAVQRVRSCNNGMAREKGSSKKNGKGYANWESWMRRRSDVVMRRSL
jgi:hypothetical protein